MSKTVDDAAYIGLGLHVCSAVCESTNTFSVTRMGRTNQRSESALQLGRTYGNTHTAHLKKAWCKKDRWNQV